MKSKLAITSFVLGIISFLPIVTILLDITPFEYIIFLIIISQIISIIGLIIGIMSIFEIRKNKLKGIWYGILGIILSLLGPIALILLTIAVAKAGLNGIL